MIRLQIYVLSAIIKSMFRRTVWFPKREHWSTSEIQSPWFRNWQFWLTTLNLVLAALLLLNANCQRQINNSIARIQQLQTEPIIAFEVQSLEPGEMPGQILTYYTVRNCGNSIAKNLATIVPVISKDNTFYVLNRQEAGPPVQSTLVNGDSLVKTVLATWEAGDPLQTLIGTPVYLHLLATYSDRLGRWHSSYYIYGAYVSRVNESIAIRYWPEKQSVE